MLKSQLSFLSEPDENPFEISESDVEDANDSSQIIDNDEADEDIDIEC